MKYRKWITSGALIAAIAIAMILFGDRKSRSIERTAVPVERIDVPMQPQPAALKPLVRNPAPPALSAPSQPVVAPPDAEVEPADPVRVRPDQVLATVNGQPIQLKDLLPYAPVDTEKAMTAEEYQSRLNRAIEMELTFQAATAHGIDLTAGQKNRLARIAQKQQATMEGYKERGISWSSVTTAQLEFEKRLTSALMLQQNLVAKEAAAAPSSDVIVQARYEQALRGVLAQLKASAKTRTSVPAL